MILISIISISIIRPNKIMKVQFFYSECTSQAIKVKQRALNVSTTMNRVIIEEILERKYPDKSMAKKVLIKTNKK